MTTGPLLPPSWLIHSVVAAVWLYEGLWCKLLQGEPRQFEVVSAVPRYGPAIGMKFLKVLGVVEVMVALWVVSGITPWACAVFQTVLLASLNACGLCWARHIIHDPAGMVIKNFAFLVLAWVSASVQLWK